MQPNYLCLHFYSKNSYSPLGVPEELSTRWIYNTTYDAFKQWIPASQADLYLKAGYYTVEVDEKFRVIAINSNFCYGFNVYVTYNCFSIEIWISC